jgi:hypothetical protein
MDDTPTLAIAQWMAERKTTKPGGKGRPAAQVPPISELTHLAVKQCQNRLYYSAQLHRYIRLYEVIAFFELGKPVTIVRRDGTDTTVPTLMHAFADRVERGELEMTVSQLRGLVNANDCAMAVHDLNNQVCQLTLERDSYLRQLEELQESGICSVALVGP